MRRAFPILLAVATTIALLFLTLPVIAIFVDRSPGDQLRERVAREAQAPGCRLGGVADAARVQAEREDRRCRPTEPVGMRLARRC